jgi:DMSO/TMAO reductase YedYZ heme-binding membrane subunit
MAVAVAILGSTKIGQVVGKASGHYLLFYSGVFVLLALTATVFVGLISTDRIFMTPASRVTAQALHRSISAGALAFLLIHIVTEIVSARSSVVDVVLPFLDHGKTFYIGLGTIASDLMVMIAVTGIFRARMAATMSPLKWRVLHSTAYASWVLAIVHGMLAGRPAKAFFGFSGFVAWSYGLCVAVVAVALAVRFVATDRTGQAQGTQSQPVEERPAPPWMAAALAPALGQARLAPSPLAVAPVRPFQRALPAAPSPSATPARLGLPAGRGDAGHDETRTDADWGDSAGQPGHDETGVDLSGDGARGAFGRAELRADFGRDGTQASFGRDGQGANFGRDGQGANFGRDGQGASFGLDGQVAGFGRDGQVAGFGRDVVEANLAGSTLPGRASRGAVQGYLAEDDSAGRYGRTDVRGGFGGADPRGFGRDDSLGYPPGDGPDGRYGRADTGSYAGRDGARGSGRDSEPGYGRADPRGYLAEDDSAGRYGRADVRGGFGGADPRGFGRDDSRGYPAADPGGRYGGGPAGQDGFGGADPRGYGRADSRGYQAEGDQGGRYNGADPRGYGRDDARGYGGADARGYAQDDGRGYDRDNGRGNGRDGARGYGRDDGRGYGRDNERGYPAEDYPPGRYDQNAPRGGYRQDDDYADQEVTGPLPAVPYSRYGTRQ